MYWSPFTEYSTELNKLRDLSEKSLGENDGDLDERLRNDNLAQMIKRDGKISNGTLKDGLRAFGRIAGERTVAIDSRERCPANMEPAINTANAEMSFPRVVLQTGVICVPQGQAGQPSDVDLKKASFSDIKAYLKSIKDPEAREREIKRLARNEIQTAF
jgi:hypothetical protein